MQIKPTMQTEIPPTDYTNGPQVLPYSTPYEPSDHSAVEVIDCA
ncbi:Uncharacterised protein [BD1-7 clade bacterium]|uniref:Uncharacterized protein n=1 Tax=BD1-7 clade bacterium TaxID=2029982 RepID=A0A5S9PUX7_9GAMM|nr:Uncharacterised protein [BD1-7 clade bacterium]